MRSISAIARDIKKDWKKPNYAALPYLMAMQDINTITEDYGADTARSVVIYFLGNAQTWRGEKAREIKKELNNLLHL